MPKILDTSSAKPGDMKPWSGLTAPDGWLFCCEKTIGSAASGATLFASAYARDLYVHLWNNYTNTELIIQTSGGVNTTRGANALADFNANKRLPVLDIRGRSVVGKDNMGGATASRLTSGLSGINGTVLGAAGGTETHTLSTAQMPLHKHALNGANAGPGSTFPSLISAIEGEGITIRIQDPTPTDLSPTMGNNGSGSTHQNTQPTFVATYVIKY